MENKYFPWNDFKTGFGKEMATAEDVFDNMVESGLEDLCLTNMDFTFISDKKENLIRLADFIRKHYPYTVEEVVPYEDIWEINGETNEIPITKDNLLCWVLDMYKRGYEFDARLDAYGGLFDPKYQLFPDLNTYSADHYFDTGVDCYEKGDLSGSVFNWSLAIAIDSEHPSSYYSRAIAKEELHIWKYALLDYDKAIEIAPDFASALINRGALKDDHGDYHGAIADYKIVLNIEGTDTENLQQAHFNLGNSYLKLDNSSLACSHWKRAVEYGANDAQERINTYCNQIKN